MTETHWAERFHTRYDDEHTFTFFEDEDGALWFYGWPDEEFIRREVTAWYDTLGHSLDLEGEMYISYFKANIEEYDSGPELFWVHPDKGGQHKVTRAEVEVAAE